MTTDPSASSAAMEAPAGRLRPGAGVRQRQAVLPEPLRGFHQRLLGAFVTQTGPPDASVVGRLAAELQLDPQAALAALAAIDLVHTDPAARAMDGRIAAGAAGRTVADRCCPHINFHLDGAAADAYRQAHPGMTGRLLDQAGVVQAAGRAFGGLLDPSNPPEETP